MSNSVRPHRRQPTRLRHPWDSPGKNTGVGCHFLLQCMKVKVKSLSHVRLFATPWTAAYRAPPPMGFSRQVYWSGVPSPSPTQLVSTQSQPVMSSSSSRVLTGEVDATGGQVQDTADVRDSSSQPVSVEAKRCFSAFPPGVESCWIFSLFYMSSFNYVSDNDEERCNLVMRVNLKRLNLLPKTTPTRKEGSINCHYSGIMELELLTFLLSFVYLSDSGITYSKLSSFHG